jgi:hypothetical protein
MQNRSIRLWHPRKQPGFRNEPLSSDDAPAQSTGFMKKITKSNYQKHKLYPVIVRTVATILETNNVVTPVELLLRLERISKQQLEDWRFGRIPYLERVCIGNLSKLSAILRVLDHHARAIGLKPSQTVYHKWGRGGKHIVLRFSKTGEPALEAAYSRHYVATSRPASGESDSVPVEGLRQAERGSE